MVKMNICRRLTAALLLLMLMLTAGASLAEETPLADFDYTILGKRVLLKKYKGTNTSVHVADSYEIDGVSYGVTLDSATVFRNNTNCSTTLIPFPAAST